MLLLLPISRFRVEYQVAAGRPFSIFERLILKAIFDGASAVEDLRAIFYVHPRLILEALVTLTQAGWLVVGGGELQGFRLTSAGSEAVASGREPRSRIVESRYAWVVMERLTGALINEGAVRYLQKNELTDHADFGVKIPERVFNRRLNEAQVDVFLPRARTEWLLRIDSIDMKTRQAQWLPVTVDPDSQLFDDNLPAIWRDRLCPALLEEIEKSPRSHDSNVRRHPGPKLAIRSRAIREGDDIPRLLEERCPVRILKTDFLFTDVDHGNYLQFVFSNAASKIFVASAFLRLNCVQSLRSEILNALGRGVTIDALWGYNSAGKGEADAIEELKKIAYEAKRNRYPGKLKFNRTASGSHAKLILWDRDDVIEACVGSFNWLSVPHQVAITAANSAPGFTNISVCLRQPRIVARLIRGAVSLWSGGGTQLDVTPDRWEAVASVLEQRDVEAPTTDQTNDSCNGTAQIIVDVEHEAMLRTWLSSAVARLFVVSHRLGTAAQTRLVAASRKNRMGEFKFVVLYGQKDTDEPIAQEIATIVKNAQGTVHEIPGVHAKIVVCDNVTCVGSYNFLSTDVYGTASKAKELSVVLDSPDSVEWILQRINEKILSTGN